MLFSVTKKMASNRAQAFTDAEMLQIVQQCVERKSVFDSGDNMTVGQQKIAAWEEIARYLNN